MVVSGSDKKPKVKPAPFRSDPDTLRCPSNRWLPSESPPCVETQEKLLSTRKTHTYITTRTKSTQRWYYPQGSCDEMSCDRALLTPLSRHISTQEHNCVGKRSPIQTSGRVPSQSLQQEQAKKSPPRLWFICYLSIIRPYERAEDGSMSRTCGLPRSFTRLVHVTPSHFNAASSLYDLSS